MGNIPKLSKIKSPIKLLFLDIDGTLLPGRFSEPNPRIVELVNNVSKKINVCFCTGRSLEDVKKEIKRFGLENSFHIVENGTKVLGPMINVEYVKNIDKNDVSQILDAGKSELLDYGICENGIWKDSVDDVMSENITIISLNSNSKEMTGKILKSIEHLKESYSIVVAGHSSFPDGANVHITHKEAHKGFGVKYLQNKLKISKKETAGAGDMLNDLPMLNECGIKIVMGNAHEDLLKIADKVVGRVENEGLEDFLTELC